MIVRNVTIMLFYLLKKILFFILFIWLFNTFVLDFVLYKKMDKIFFFLLIWNIGLRCWKMVWKSK